MIKAIPDLHHSVERPIIKAIVCQLVDNAILPVYEHYHYQPILKSRNTSGKTIRDDDRKPFRFKSERYLEVEASITPTDGLNVPYPIVHQNERVDPIFLDMDLEVAIQPLYKHMEYNLNFKFHTSSLEYLNEWKDHLDGERMMGKDRIVHNIQYAYRLPKDIHTLLEEIYDAREAKGGYGDEYLVYLTKHMTSGMIKATGGDHQQLMITNMDIEVIGYPAVELQIDEQDDNYIATLEYKFYMSTPRTLQAIYPVQIHQTLLSLKYLPNKNINRPSYGPARGFLLPRMGEKPDVFKPINLTRFDDSRISKPPHGYGVMWRALLSLDTGEPDEILCNLYDLPGYCMPEWIFCFLKNFREEATVPYKSPFVFSLHRKSDLMDVSYLTIDDRLNVRTTKPLDIRDIWHLSLSVATESVAVGMAIREQMCELCEVHVKDLYNLAYLIRGSQLTTGSYRTTDGLDLCKEPGANMFTVESVIIEAFRSGMLKNEDTIRS